MKQPLKYMFCGTSHQKDIIYFGESPSAIRIQQNLRLMASAARTKLSKHRKDGESMRKYSKRDVQYPVLLNGKHFKVRG